jgi:NAD(P)-dependent dehydrogenase (short-subunit alcohol dehydrogenase family)
MSMDVKGKVAVITGAGGGIGQAVATELSNRNIGAIAMVDVSPAVEEAAFNINKAAGRNVASTYVGDTTDSNFRQKVYNEVESKHGQVSICIPAAGITRDSLAVKADKQTGKVQIYPVEKFRLVVDVNLIAPVYWAVEMTARIAQSRIDRKLGRWTGTEPIEGVAIFIGSVSSLGNKGQIAYAATKRGLEGAAKTLMMEAMFYGVRCAVIHPGFTDTGMVRAMGDEYINKYILPSTQLKRLIRPQEIANAICFMISNSAVSGELWADAGWHPSN